MRHSVRKCVAITTVALVAGFSSGPAWSEQLDEIVVTSERRESSLQDVPIAVSAMGMGELERLQVGEARDLQRYVPSLNMFNNVTHPSNLSLSLRGGLQQDASLVVAESPVGIYVDDIYVGRLNGNNVTLSDIERVEVLRGPQGTLYGRNTGYGAVRFISRTPDDEFWLNAAAGAGNDDQRLLRASIGGPLSDSWAGSTSVQYKEKGGQYFNFDPSANTETGDEENLSVRGKLRFTGLERLDAIVSLTYSESDNDSNQSVLGITPGIADNCQDLVGDPTLPCPPGVTTQFTSDDLVFPNGTRGVRTAWTDRDPAPPLRNKPQANTEQTILGITVAYDINDALTIKSITGYVGLDGNFMTDFAGNNGAVGGSESDSDQITQEIQFLGSAFGERLKYVAGAFYLNEEAEQLWGWNAGIPLSRSTIMVETDSISFFGEASYNFTENLKLTTGLRFTEDDKDFSIDFQSFLPPGGPLAPPARIVDSQKPDDWTPKVALDYTFETGGVLDNALVYGSYSEGFKGAGWSAISITTPVGERYNAETNETYEVGFKGEWFDNRIRTNFAYYFSDIQDIQQNATVTLPDGSLAFPVQNSGDAEIQGLEFEITAVPVDGLSVFFSGTAFTDGEYKNLRPGSAAANAPFLYGISEAETPQTPDYSFNIGFDYSFDAPGDFVGDVTIGSDYYEIDDYMTSATNDFRSSGWDLWNAFISVDLGENWELKLTGKNLGDDDIVTSGSRGLGGFIMLPPSEYLLTATYNYQ